MSQDTTRYVTEEEMDSTPTGLNMRLGTFVIPFADSDPTTETRDVADGTTRLWVDDGELKLSSFSLNLNSWTTFSASTPTVATAVEETAVAPPILLPAAAFTLATGSPALAVRGSTANTWQQFPAWALDAASDESVTAVAWIPAVDEYTKMTFYFACPDANSGVVYLSMFISTVIGGEQIDQAVEVSLADLMDSPGVADQVVAVEFTDMTLGTSTGSLLRVNVYRNGSNVADTYAADVWFLGAVIAAT